MNKKIAKLVNDIEQQSIGKFTEKAYLEYSMYVILDRALPHIGDGLKPVQRRIIYAMDQLGLNAQAKFKKSARTVGDVLGKFHPHGDAACYEAMVLLAQPFSTHYPAIDGQGNWGAPDDPKSFAAMRYTEARLTKYAGLLLQELDQGTVEWASNFDGTLKEPKVLSSRVPNVLLNGGTGIAVGMATDILPHNFNEVINACVYLLKNPKASLKDINKIILGPDFPTKAEIVSSKEDIFNMYKDGSGSIRQRATYIVEKGEIIVTALPYQASLTKIMGQIAQQMMTKKLPMVVDLRDESDHENPTRLVIVLKSNRVNTEEVVSHLFATTDLEKNFRANFNIINLDGRPKVMNLLDLLKEWLEFRTTVVKKKLQFRLDFIANRLHLIQGFLIAHTNIDKVIKIIRDADEPKSQLIKKFKLSDKQVEAILNMKLRHLAKLEREKLETEQSLLLDEERHLRALLASPKKLKEFISKELLDDAQKYGDTRSSPIVKRDLSQAIKEDQRISAEAITVILSKQGWIRVAKGCEIDPFALNYKAGDGCLMAIQGQSNQNVIVFDSTGRVYSVAAYLLPSARSQGEPLTARFNPPSGSKFLSIMMETEDDYVLVGQDAGYGFITQLKNLNVKNKAGKQLINLTKNSEVIKPQFVGSIDNKMVALITTEGRLLCFDLSELPILAKGKGNKMIHIPPAKIKSREEVVKGMVIFNKKETLVIYAGKVKLKLDQKGIIDYYANRAKRGKKLPKRYQKVDKILKS